MEEAAETAREEALHQDKQGKHPGPYTGLQAPLKELPKNFHGCSLGKASPDYGKRQKTAKCYTGCPVLRRGARRAHTWLRLLPAQKVLRDQLLLEHAQLRMVKTALRPSG